MKELADREAAKAEAETPDSPDEPTPDDADGDEEAEDGEQDTPPEQEDEPPTAEQQAAMFEAEVRRHADTWAALCGITPDELDACPTCGGVGFLSQPLKTNPDTKRCEKCGGRGELITHALKPDTALMPCDRCSGYGYVPDMHLESSASTNQNGEAAVTVAPPAEVPPEVLALRAAGYTVVEPVRITSTP